MQSLFWHRNLNLEFGVPLCNISKSSVNTYVVWNRAICLVKDLAVIKVHSFCTFLLTFHPLCNLSFGIVICNLEFGVHLCNISKSFVDFKLSSGIPKGE